MHDGAMVQCLLDTTTVLDHLRARGILGGTERARARSLGGGVSNTVIAVEAESCRVVVKQALSRLRVDREWLADPSRTCTEGRALRVVAHVAEGSVPRVVDLDETQNVLVIEAAPPGSADWRHRLLQGAVSAADVETARQAGDLLGTLHAATAYDATLASQFDCWRAFEELRITPYFRSMVADLPSLRDVVLPHVDRMSGRRICLVHGDLSPKNLLVGDALLWLIDFEVACWGDPAFDVAFMLTHLCMKALHHPADAATLGCAARAFLAAYRAHAGALIGDDAHVAGLLGCLLMARVDGRSPAEYLDATTRERVWEAGLWLADVPPARLEDAVGAAMGWR